MSTTPLERAIAAWEATLMVRTKERDPLGWAALHAKIAHASLRMDLQDDHDQPDHPQGMLDRAISSADQALTVYSEADHPRAWADTQFNLASALGRRAALFDGRRASDSSRSARLFLDFIDSTARDSPNDNADTMARFRMEGWAMAGAAQSLALSERRDEERGRISSLARNACEILAHAGTDAAIVNGLIRTGKFLVNEALVKGDARTGIAVIARAVELADTLGDPHILADASYALAMSSSQIDEGDSEAIKRILLIPNYETALGFTQNFPIYYFEILRHLVHARCTLFSRKPEEEQDNLRKLLLLVDDSAARLAQDNAKSRTLYLLCRSQVYLRVLQAPPQFSTNANIPSADQVTNDVAASITEAETIDYPGERLNVSQLRLKLATTFCMHGRGEEARALVSGIEPTGIPFLDAGLFEARAIIASRTGRNEDALDLYRQAVDRVINAPSPFIRLTAKLYLVGRAQVLISLRRWEEAYADLRLALELEAEYIELYDRRFPLQIDQAAINLSGHRGWLSDFSQPMFGYMATVCAHLGRYCESLDFSERARGSVLCREMSARGLAPPRDQAQGVPETSELFRLARESTDTAFVQYLIGEREGFAYVVTSGGLEVFPMPHEWDPAMVSLREGRVSPCGTETSLRELSDAFAENPSEGQRARWFAGLDEIGVRMHDVLFAPVREYLEKENVKRLVVSTHAGLERLPWNAICERASDGPHYLADRYVIYKVPFLSWFTRTPEEQHPGHEDRVFVSGIDPELYFLELEEQLLRSTVGEVGADHFRSPRCRTGQELQQAIVDMTRVHIACHGRFDDADPFRTRLILDARSGTGISLEEVLTGDLALKRDSSVVLSACEVGLVTPDQGGEYLSAVTAFLLCGARQVVAPLWAVNDLATSLLMYRFYAEWEKKPDDAPAALNHAQTWLRRCSGADLSAVLKENTQALSLTTGLRLRLLQLQKQFALQENEVPFAHPYWWAGFELTGTR